MKMQMNEDNVSDSQKMSGGYQDQITKQQSPVHREESQLLTLTSEGNNRRPYPKAVFFIIGNEFCERFSYYGMRAILILYLTNWLKFGADPATSIYHAFSVLCYFSPIFGAILADGYLGKYKTILYVSLVYAAGNIVMTFTAFPPPFWVGPMFGLILIGLGTGGIKPCVSAFGGDQFAQDQEKERNQFFSIFYFAINMGSLLSMLITPLVREYTECFGSNCFPVAFGIPAILMLTAVALFVFGRRYYKILPPGGSVISRMVCAIGRAVKNKWSSSESKEYWLYHADDKYDMDFLGDVKCVLHVFWLFLPLPVFWALFDQQGSRWTLQSTQLNLHLTGEWYILPDQIQAINAFLILAFIPLFEFIVYPLLDVCKIPNRPLQRMVAGMAFAAGAFVIAGFLQLKIDNSLRELQVNPGSSKLGFINISPCSVQLNEPFNISLLPSNGQQSVYPIDIASGTHTISVTAFDCNESGSAISVNQTIHLAPQKAYFMYLDYYKKPVLSELFEYPLKKSKNGGPLLGVLYINHTNLVHDGLATFKQGRHEETYGLNEGNLTNYKEFFPGKFTITLTTESGEFRNSDSQDLNFAESGQLVTCLIVANDSGFRSINYVSIHSNDVSFWYQIPQYIIITVGEILFSISGLAFAYSQAPASMKSVVQAGWLLTTAFGDVIVVAVASVHLMAQAVEFFFFAGLMIVATVIYAVMSYFYKGVQPLSQSVDDLKRLSSSDDNQEAS